MDRKKFVAESIEEYRSFQKDSISEEEIKSSEKIAGSEKVKDLVSKAFKIEDWNSEEGKTRRKAAMKMVGNLTIKFKDIVVASLTNREKAKRMESLLNGSGIISLILGVRGFVMNTHTVSNPSLWDKVFKGAEKVVDYGGTMWLKIAAILFILAIIHKILSKAGIFISDVKGEWEKAKVEVRKNMEESLLPKSEIRSVNLLLESTFSKI